MSVRKVLALISGVRRRHLVSFKYSWRRKVACQNAARDAAKKGTPRRAASVFSHKNSNRTLPPRSECSIASLIWDGLYVAVIGKVNLPEATTLAPSVSAARILGRYSS